ncbi:hypothetical protein ACLK19_26170 [Escherichia coli]
MKMVPGSSLDADNKVTTKVWDSKQDIFSPAALPGDPRIPLAPAWLQRLSSCSILIEVTDLKIRCRFPLATNPLPKGARGTVQVQFWV